jgi:sister-chromatid-cohesion protein PDS5
MQVRIEVVQVSGRVLENSVDFRQQISSCLRDRGRDHEEVNHISSMMHCLLRIPFQSVRASVVSCVCDVAHARPDVIDSDLLRSIGDRMLDKKLAVRRLTMERMADIFHTHCARYWGEAKPVPVHSKKFSWIPQQLLSVLTRNLPDRGTHVHQVCSHDQLKIRG